MKKNVPGFLYAKSLRDEESPGEGYRTWFRHAALEPYAVRLAEIRSQFHWVADSVRRHPPVVAFEPLEGGKEALAVRFSDAGKDPFGRPQTLRMEAFLVPVGEAAFYWDGTFRADPDPGSACFRVESEAPADDFPGLGGGWQIHGDASAFSFGRQPDLRYPAASPRASRDSGRNAGLAASQGAERRETRGGRVGGKKGAGRGWMMVLAGLLVLSAGGHWAQYGLLKSAEHERAALALQVKNLEARLAAMGQYFGRMEEWNDVAPRMEERIAGLQTGIAELEADLEQWKTSLKAMKESVSPAELDREGTSEPDEENSVALRFEEDEDDESNSGGRTHRRFRW